MSFREFSSALNKIGDRQRNGLRIRVAFFVIYDSVFPGINLLRLMLSDPLFEVKLIIIPDVLRGMENMLTQIDRCVSSFDKLNAQVMLGYDKSTNSFQDFSNEIDIAYMSNPYESMTHEYFRLSYLVHRDVLPIYMHYGFSIYKYDYKVLSQRHMQDFWRIYLDTSDCLEEMQKLTNLEWNNCRTVGYCKMDGISKPSAIPDRRKCIILAPHHTIEPNNHLNLGSFLEYINFYFDLPSKYPNIDFVFRPHPMLMDKLMNGGYIPKGVITAAFDRFFKEPNITYSVEQDYFLRFENSDAMIHDCGSFVAEYLFTGKPICFAKSRRTDLAAELGGVGTKCIQQHYIATSALDLYFFIDHVVLEGSDPLKATREQFAKAHLMPCGGMVSKALLDMLKIEALAS